MLDLILLIAIISIGSFIFFGIISWLTGSRIRTRRGMTLANPTDLPDLLNDIHQATKMLQRKVKNSTNATPKSSHQSKKFEEMVLIEQAKLEAQRRLLHSNKRQNIILDDEPLDIGEDEPIV